MIIKYELATGAVQPRQAGVDEQGGYGLLEVGEWCDYWAVTHEVVDGAVRLIPPDLQYLRSSREIAVQGQLDARIAAGLSFGGLVVDIDDGSRANLQGLVLMGMLVAQGVATWPDDYARGWVSASGARIPLPAATDGRNLALAASAYYSALVQHAQDLADAVRAAGDADELAAIDLTAGWPS